MDNPFLVPIVMFIAIAVVLYAFIQARHRERMAIIEKGYDASLLEQVNGGRTGKFGALKFGIVAIGIGLGLIIGNLLDTNNILDGEVAYFAMATLLGGIGLIIYYMIVRDKN